MIKFLKKPLISRAKNLLLDRSGPLTRDLLLEPANFGLGKVPSKLKPDAATHMVCGFCSTGCSLKIHMKDGEAVSLTPSPDAPVNQGMACPKGWEALTPLGSPNRGISPLLRKNGKMEPVSWEKSLEVFCEKFKSIQNAHGKESVAFLGTGQMVSEELAFLGSLAKFGMGMIHGDGNTRQCMATSATAYKQSFGFDAPPYSYMDFEESDVLVFIGANPCIAHPIMWERVCRNKHNPEIIVIDPRKTETAMAATLHIPIKPKSDLVFFYGIANELIKKGWVDQTYIENHTEGFEAFKAHVDSFTSEEVKKESEIPTQEFENIARIIGEGKRVSFWWTMGVNQGHEAVRLAQAIINIALMTGNMGRPGTGANSITGQCNAMGSRLFSNTTNLLGGHDFTNPIHREKIASILNIDASHIPDENSMPYHEILQGIDKGSIKGLWVLATNPGHSWIGKGEFRDILKKLDFLVVQDMYSNTDTAALADLFFPAAGWGEKDGTFINSERRIGLIKNVKKAPGKALSDFRIFQLIAQAWGCGEMFDAWKTPEDVFQLLKQCTKGRPCEITGIRDYKFIDGNDGVQWPFPLGDALQDNERRLFEDGMFFHNDGRARFIFDEPREGKERPDRKFPFILLSGRGSAAQWHTQTRTGESAVLRKLHPGKSYVEINSEDAEELGVRQGKMVEISSRRGTVQVLANITPAVQPGQIFMPMHYPEVNFLTLPEFDPHSHQPSYKYCAVRVSCC